MIWNKTSDETEKQDGKGSFVHDLLQSQNIGKYLLNISFHLVQICVCWIRCRIQNWHKMRLGVQHVLGQVASMLIRKDAIQVFERFSQQESFHRIFMRASLFKLFSEPWLFCSFPLFTWLTFLNPAYPPSTRQCVLRLKKACHAQSRYFWSLVKRYM